MLIDGDLTGHGFSSQLATRNQRCHLRFECRVNHDTRTIIPKIYRHYRASKADFAESLEVIHSSAWGEPPRFSAPVSNTS